ncbi:glycosyltransferase [Weissella confusa]|uniref:Glycosyltransferase n=1 Tax=Weissella confusa TaxID=1583 RepID=A0AAJ3DAZ6_WEICO|nr:glycosyltransferase [Weissella confusa]NBA11175.1 glycosyltransferase [Weissella confusa]
MSYKLTYSVVLFNQSESEINQIVKNLEGTIPLSVNDFTIYLINNSVDNLGLTKYLAFLEKDNEHITAITPQKNLGFGAGHNMAINLVNSDFHFIVNPDVIIPDSYQIESMIKVAIETGAVLVAPKVLYPNGDLQPLVKLTPTVFDMAIRFLGEKVFKNRQRKFAHLDTGYDAPIISDNLPGSFLMGNTDVLKKVGGFDERYFLYMEDSDLSRKMATEGITMYTPNAYVEHELQRNNRKTFNGQVEMLKSMVKYFNKWGWRLW